MPDYQNFFIRESGTVNVNIPRVFIHGTVNDSSNGSVIADFTGSGVIVWPGVVTTLTAAQRRDMMDLIAKYILDVKAGILNG